MAQTWYLSKMLETLFQPIFLKIKELTLIVLDVWPLAIYGLGRRPGGWRQLQNWGWRLTVFYFVLTDIQEIWITIQTYKRFWICTNEILNMHKWDIWNRHNQEILNREVREILIKNWRDLEHHPYCKNEELSGWKLVTFAILPCPCLLRELFIFSFRFSDFVDFKTNVFSFDLYVG